MLQIALNAPGRFTAADVAPPVVPDGWALTRVLRVGVCGTDLHAYRGRQPFFSYPRVLGHELAVEVVEPGAHSALRRGDRCSVEPYLNCGRCIACRRGRPNCCTRLSVLGVHVDGGMGEGLAVPAHKLHASAKLSLDQLALVETLAIGAHAVERAQPERGEFALVVGAGPIGLATLQFVQATGAKVAVMDVNSSRLDFCTRRLGVEHALQGGEAAQVEEQLRAIGEGDLPTVVFDATGHAGSMKQSFAWAASGGRVVFVGLVQGEISFSDPEFHRRELTLLASRNARPETFRDILGMIEAGRIDTSPWITHRLRLQEVPDRFAAVADDPALLKAMIDVEGSAA